MKTPHLTRNNSAAIRRLVDKFLDGDTTPSQEAMIYDYYASRRNLPDDLEQYRPMFGWYSSMTPRRKYKYRKIAGIAASVAAIVGVAITMAHKSAVAKEQLYATYHGSYIIRDGVRINDIPLIINNLTQAEQMADSITAMAERETIDFEQFNF